MLLYLIALQCLYGLAVRPMQAAESPAGDLPGRPGNWQHKHAGEASVNAKIVTFTCCKMLLQQVCSDFCAGTTHLLCFHPQGPHLPCHSIQIKRLLRKAVLSFCVITVNIAMHPLTYVSFAQQSLQCKYPSAICVAHKMQMLVVAYRSLHTPKNHKGNLAPCKDLPEILLICCSCKHMCLYAFLNVVKQDLEDDTSLLQCLQHICVACPQVVCQVAAKNICMVECLTSVSGVLQDQALRMKYCPPARFDLMRINLVRTVEH